MSLLRVLQSDLASVLMQYLDTSHRQLLAVARPLRRSQMFARAAAAGQDFNPFIFDRSLRDDIFCRRMLVSMSGCEMHYNRLWTSIPETIITTDFLGFACAKHDSWAYKYVPTTMRVEPAFVRALVNYTETFDPKEDESLPLSNQRYIPDEMLSEDRELAMDCARKGINPFGSENQLYVHDQDIAEAFLKTCQFYPRGVYEKISASPWHNREWVLRMCRDAPGTASFLLEKANGDMQLEIIEAVPRDYVYRTFIGNSLGADQRIWRAAVRREPRVIQLVGSHCRVLRSDKPLLTRVFRENPKLYWSCHEHIKSLAYVAVTVFERDGLQIRDSPFVDKIQFVMIALQQNGLALRWVSERLQSNLAAAHWAVRQNGLALAWVRWPRGCKPTAVIEAAIRQNPAAAAFGDFA